MARDAQEGQLAGAPWGSQGVAFFGIFIMVQDPEALLHQHLEFGSS